MAEDEVRDEGQDEGEDELTSRVRPLWSSSQPCLYILRAHEAYAKHSKVFYVFADGYGMCVFCVVHALHGGSLPSSATIRGIVPTTDQPTDP